METYVPTRHPAPIPVPRLRYKLNALYTACGLDDAKLGRMLGLTGRAIRNWVTGDASRYPDHVPARHFEALAEIFRSKLPQPHSASEVRAWLRAPSHHGLQEALQSDAPPVDWMTLVERAGRSSATVICEGADRATMRRNPFNLPQSSLKVAVGQTFRLRLNLSRAGWLCIVQLGTGGWLGLELTDREAVLPVDRGDCLLPPEPPYLRESEAGTRRYVLLHATLPFPSDVAATLLNSARTGAPLHAETLVRLAHVVATHNVDMKVLDIAFQEPGDTLCR